MENKNLTPEESLQLITKTINEAKERFSENGFAFIFWGIIISLATLGHFFLIRYELYNFIGFVYLIMPVGFIVSFFYYFKKRKERKVKNIVSQILSIVSNILGINYMILGFVFWKQLGEVLIPIFLIMMAIHMFISGMAIRYKPLLISGLILNICGFTAFYFRMDYQLLIISLATLITLVIPGILLYKLNKKENV